MRDHLAGPVPASSVTQRRSHLTPVERGTTADVADADAARRFLRVRRELESLEHCEPARSAPLRLRLHRVRRDFVEGRLPSAAFALEMEQLEEETAGATQRCLDEQDDLTPGA